MMSIKKRISALALVGMLAVGSVGVVTTSAAPAPEKITIKASGVTNKTIYVGQKVNLTIKTTPTKAKKAVSWKTSNKKVATVKKGVVTGKKVGKVTITATSKANKEISAKIKLTVKKLNIKSIKLNYSKRTLGLNCRKKVNLRVKAWSPTTVKAKYKKVTWTTSNKKVAKVSKKGVVTAKGKGTATITATTLNGKTAKCKVTVRKNIVTRVNIYRNNVTLTVGQTYKRTATVTPANADVQKIAYTSLNPAVATVAADGTVTAKKVGSAVIRAKATDGSGRKTFYKVIVKAEETTTPSTPELKKYTVTAQEVGDSYAYIIPGNAEKAEFTANNRTLTVTHDDLARLMRLYTTENLMARWDSVELKEETLAGYTARLEGAGATKTLTISGSATYSGTYEVTATNVSNEYTVTITNTTTGQIRVAKVTRYDDGSHTMEFSRRGTKYIAYTPADGNSIQVTRVADNERVCEIVKTETGHSIVVYQTTVDKYGLEVVYYAE